MHRFFLPSLTLSSSPVRFPDDTARQIRSVLRLKPGERVLALDNQGNEYELELVQVDASAVLGEVRGRRPAVGEPAARLILYIGLTQREKFEWILQKCTEVGVSAFAPFISSRSLVQDARDGQKKHDRWQKILQEAAEQSGRGRIPELRLPVKFEQALAQVRTETGLALIAWEDEHTTGLKQALSPAPHPAMRFGVFIGPEGGFSAEEVALARQAGLLPVSLGLRILRMETAAVVAAALVLHEVENRA